MKITNSENSKSSTSLSTNPNMGLNVTELCSLDDLNDNLIQEILESNGNLIKEFFGSDEAMITSWLGLEQLKNNEVNNCLRFTMHFFIE